MDKERELQLRKNVLSIVTPLTNKLKDHLDSKMWVYFALQTL